eukprot:PhF_6_TR27207/c0_g1_i1/m.40017/K02209/MCM5, CDC46; DNA replication licensing factor MCM5
MQSDLGRISTAAPHGSDAGGAHMSHRSLHFDNHDGLQPFLSTWETTRDILRTKFREFICAFRSAHDSTCLLYKKQLQSNLYAGRNYIEVVWDDLSHFSEDLGQALRDKAVQSIMLFEEVLRELAEQEKYFAKHQSHDVQLQVLWASNRTKLRDIGMESVSRLVCVPGLIIKVSKTRLRCTRAILQCQSCKNTVSLPVSKDLEFPKKCLANTNPPPGTPACRPNPYTILSQSCEYEDQQTIKLQELPSDVPPGEMPRCMTVLVDRYLTDRVCAGNRVLVIAINSVSDSRKSSQRTVGLRSQFLRAVGLMSLTSEQSVRPLDNAPPMTGGGGMTATVRLPIWHISEEKFFEELSKRPTLYEDIAASIDPAVFGVADIKKTIACLLFGGTRKRTTDGTLLRGDMNVLLMGDPSTAKSQLLKYVEKIAPVGLYTSGKGGSAAGLTAAVVRGEGGEWWLEAGSLVLADGGVVCIDEFDKMRLQDQVAIHEAMEQQTISVSKANISTVLNARCSVLAAANPMMGSFDPTKTDDEQINFQSSILSRFDAIFRLVDKKDYNRDVRIASHVLSLHKQHSGRTLGATGANPTASNLIEAPLLQKYIAYAKATCTPLISAEAKDVLCNFFTKARAEANESLFSESAPTSTSGGVIHLTVRQLESLVRMTEALAKMQLSRIATGGHAEEAIRLFQVSTIEANRGGGMVSESLTPAEQGLVHKVESAIRSAVTVGFGIKTTRLTRSLETQGFEKKWINLALYAMSRRGDVEFRSSRSIVYRKL